MNQLGSSSRRGFLGAAGVMLAGGAIGCPIVARADSGPLANKSITFISGGGVGGTFDLFARMLARHLEAAIPGLTVSVKNVEQASGLLAAKMLQEGPTDGTMLLTASSGVFNAQMMGDEGVSYDARQWGWLGKHGTETRVLLRGPGADFKTFEEFRAKTATSSMAVRAKTSHAYHEAMLLNGLLGLRIKAVPGYKGPEAESALLQGEVMLAPEGYPTDLAIMESPGVGVVMRITAGSLPPKYEGAPLLRDLVANKTAHAMTLDFIDLTATMVRWVALPPNTDPEILAAWRDAFASVAVTPGYVEDSRKLNLAIEFTTGDEIAAKVAAVLQAPAELGADMQALTKCGEALAEGGENPCAVS